MGLVKIARRECRARIRTLAPLQYLGEPAQPANSRQRLGPNACRRKDLTAQVLTTHAQAVRKSGDRTPTRAGTRTRVPSRHSVASGDRRTPIEQVAIECTKSVGCGRRVHLIRKTCIGLDKLTQRRGCIHKLEHWKLQQGTRPSRPKPYGHNIVTSRRRNRLRAGHRPHDPRARTSRPGAVEHEVDAAVR